jgi:hypothetical protein
LSASQRQFLYGVPARTILHEASLLVCHLGSAVKANESRRVILLSKHLWNCFKGYRSDIANVISNSGFKLGENGVQFGLSLGINSPLTKGANAVFQAGWHDCLTMAYQGSGPRYRVSGMSSQDFP